MGWNMYKINTTCTHGGQWYKVGETYDNLPELVKPYATITEKQTKVDTTEMVQKIVKPKTAKK